MCVWSIFRSFWMTWSIMETESLSSLMKKCTLLAPSSTSKMIAWSASTKWQQVTSTCPQLSIQPLWWCWELWPRQEAKCHLFGFQLGTGCQVRTTWGSWRPRYFHGSLKSSSKMGLLLIWLWLFRSGCQKTCTSGQRISGLHRAPIFTCWTSASGGTSRSVPANYATAMLMPSRPL